MAWIKGPSGVFKAEGAVGDYWLGQSGYEETSLDAEGDTAQLKGADLDNALREAGLSTSGNVGEKRARLAGHNTEENR